MNTFVNEKTWWYLSRSSGIVAVVLLVMTVLWGVALATKFSKSIRPAWTLEVHKWLSGLAFCGVGLHLLGLYLDGYLEFGPKELFVPGTSPYRPMAVAIGVLSLYGMLAVQLTSLARKHLSRRAWHLVHLTSYLVVWGGLMHAGLAGTDTTNRYYQLLAAMMIALTVAAVIVRLVAPKRRSGRRDRRPPADGGTTRPTGNVTPAMPAPPLAAANAALTVDQRSSPAPVRSGPSFNTRDRVAARRSTTPRLRAGASPVARTWIDPLLAPSCRDHEHP